MKSFLMKSREVLNNEDAQVLGEYGFVLALVAISAVGALIFLGVKLSDKFMSVGREIENAKSVE